MPERKRFSFHFELAEFLFLVFFLFSGTMLAFSSKSFVVDFNKIGFTVLSSIQNGVFGVINGVEKSINAVKDFSRLQDDYELLSDKLKDYESMQRANTEIKRENERLKELLDFSVSVDYKNIPAHIIGRDLEGLYAIITVNKGSVHGVRKNMPVIANQNGTNGIVGKVIMVGRYTSQIMPVYDTKCSISARIQNTRDIGLVSGQGTFTAPLKLNYIRKQTKNELQYGDIVVTSGENDNYLGDIQIGTITKITEIVYNSSLIIELQPTIDFMKLEDVLIVDQKEENDRGAE